MTNFKSCCGFKSFYRKSFYRLWSNVLLCGFVVAAHAKPAESVEPIPPSKSTAQSQSTTQSQSKAKPKPAIADKAKTAPAAIWRESGAPVMGLSVSPGRVMVTEGTDTVWLYTPAGKLEKSFVPHDADSFRVFTYDSAISPDGKYGLAASVDLGARLLDLETGKVLTGLSGGMSRLNAVAYAPDGANVAIATSSAVTVSAAPERAYRPGFKGLENGAGSVAFSPDGSTLAVGGEDKSVHLFKVADGSEITVWREHKGAVRALAWSHDGKFLASGSRDGGVRVWDVAAGKRALLIAPGEGAVESLAWSAGGTVLAVAVSPPGGESTARPSEPERTPPGPADKPHPVVQIWALKSEGTTLLSTTLTNATLTSATLKRAVLGLYGARRIAFLPDGKLLAGFANARLAAYDLAAIPVVTSTPASPGSPSPGAPRPAAPQAATPQAPAPHEDAEGFRLLTGLPGGAEVVAFSPDGKWLAAGNAEAEIGVWDAGSGAFAKRIGDHARSVNSLAWPPDGTLLASGGEDRLQVARVADGKVLWSVPGRAVVAGFSLDGNTVYAFQGVYKPGVPQTLRAWGAIDGSQGAALGRLPYPMRAAISPDGLFIAADQGTTKGYLDTTELSIFKSSSNEAASKVAAGDAAGNAKLNAAHSFFLHGRVNALRWKSASRLLVDDGDYRDGYTDTDQPIPGKLGVRFFNPVTGGEDTPFKTFEMPIVALDENGRGELAAAEDRVGVHVFDAKNQEIALWPLPARSVRVKSLIWSPDGALLAIGIEGAPVRLWRVAHKSVSTP